MFRINIGLLLIALTTLLLELTLVRVFDVIWYSNMAYMVITLAMFCFGLSGIYSSLRPLQPGKNVDSYITACAVIFAISCLAILPALNSIPFNFDTIYKSPVKGSFYFLLIYFAIIIPFFFAGLIFTTVFSAYASKIQKLYCYDLAGAAIGCLIIVPLLPPIGPGGILFIACGLGLVAAACFSKDRKIEVIALASTIVLVAIPFQKEGYFIFKDHIDKRGVKQARAKNAIEESYWDPISKIDVIDSKKIKHVAYDGGSQSTYIFPFDGDYKKLRYEVEHGIGYHFYSSSVYISHALKRDSGHEVLVIGAAGGSEAKAALMYGASHVDAVEMVGHVIDIGKTKYAKYNGNIFNSPKVNAFKGEGRSFLRSTNKKYDVIQIYSNHTSSSIAAGTGAMATTYLQTVEAYKEYFSHLKPDGILHINHHVYPKMITTASMAWSDLGLNDFQKHVVVMETELDSFRDNLPTMLIKMSEWTKEDIREIQSYFPQEVKMVVNPVDAHGNMLSDAFFESPLNTTIEKESKYRVNPSTDDKPYFNFLRKSIEKLNADPKNFLNFSTASLLNSQLKAGWIPTDIVHLIVTSGASIFFGIVFTFIPLLFSNVGRINWKGKSLSLSYFSCLGAGFIIFELTFIQIFMELIGFPLYTYSTVVFALLLSAGIGSVASGKMKIAPNSKWIVPFVGVIASSILIMTCYQPYFEFFLKERIVVRILAAIVLIFPIGFFLGMPFPLGILTIEKKPKGAIAWAWAMNGLFTVIGGLASVILSIFYGFLVTLIISLFLYICAFFSYSKLRLAVRD